MEKWAKEPSPIIYAYILYIFKKLQTFRLFMKPSSVLEITLDRNLKNM